MAERREPHWVILLILGAVIGLPLTWVGVNDWRAPWLRQPATPSATSSTTGASTVTAGVHQTTEYERLSVTSLSGPQRQLLTNPPPKADFNCLAEDSFLDGENDFMWIKDIQAHEDRPWHGDGLEVEDGHIYLLAIYPINCGLATGNTDNVLRDSTLRIDVPSRTDTTMRLGAILRSASLDHPVWDGVRITGSRPFTVTPIPGSVQYMTSHITQSDEMRLPDAVFGTAQLIGDNGQDGILRACAKTGDPNSANCQVIVYAQVQVHML